MKITRLKSYAVPPRWIFLKIETDEGLAGWGACDRGQSGDRRRLCGGAVGLSHRPRAKQHRRPVASDVSGRLLSRRSDLDERHRRHRSSTVGHQGQGLRPLSGTTAPTTPSFKSKASASTTTSQMTCSTIWLIVRCSTTRMASSPFPLGQAWASRSKRSTSPNAPKSAIAGVIPSGGTPTGLSLNGECQPTSVR